MLLPHTWVNLLQATSICQVFPTFPKILGCSLCDIIILHHTRALARCHDTGSSTRAPPACSSTKTPTAAIICSSRRTLDSCASIGSNTELDSDCSHYLSTCVRHVEVLSRKRASQHGCFYHVRYRNVMRITGEWKISGCRKHQTYTLWLIHPSVELEYQEQCVLWVPTHLEIINWKNGFIEKHHWYSDPAC